MNTDHWTAQANALRHLPPNTFLKTDQAADEKLLNEWLARSDVDPIQWLINSHSRLCAKLLFWKLLDSLRSNLIGLQRTAAETTPDIINQLEEEIGYRFNRQDLALLRPMVYTHPIAVDEQPLLRFFSGLRRREMAVSSNVHGINYWQDLRNELLSLPDNADPLDWLRENHLQYAAAATLRYLIAQVIPKHTDILNDDIPKRYTDLLPKTFCRANDIQISLNAVFPIFDVYLLGLSFRIFNHQLRTSGFKQPVPVQWDGMGTVSDDMGNRYVICNRILKYTTPFPCYYWWMDYELRLLCFPAIAKTAKQLRLSFEHVKLIAIKRNLDGDRYYEMPLKALSWEIDLNPAITG